MNKQNDGVRFLAPSVGGQVPVFIEGYGELIRSFQHFVLNITPFGVERCSEDLFCGPYRHNGRNVVTDGKECLRSGYGRSLHTKVALRNLSIDYQVS